MNQYEISDQSVSSFTSGRTNLIVILIAWIFLLAATLFVYAHLTSLEALHILFWVLVFFLVVMTLGLIPAYNNKNNEKMISWEFNAQGLLLPQSITSLTHTKEPILIPWTIIKHVLIINLLKEKEIGETSYTRNILLVFFHQQTQGTVPGIVSYNLNGEMAYHITLKLPKKLHDSTLEKLTALAPHNIEINKLDELYIDYQH